MSGYRYRGTHTGPDLFDVPHRKGDREGSPYEAALRAEREARMSYWYARGYHDHEISVAADVSRDAVQKWREARGFKSNFELIGRV